MKKPTKKEYQQAKNKLKNAGKDKIGWIGKIINYIIYGVIGLIIGCLSRLIYIMIKFKKIVAYILMLLIKSTPLKWVVFIVTIAIATAYAVVKLIESGAKSDQKTKDNLEIIEEKIQLCQENS